MILRIPGQGMPAPTKDGRPGDLFIAVYTLPDSRFERRNSDLWHSASIPIEDAVLGCKFSMATLEGASIVAIPPGTQPKTLLRLRGKGLPTFASRQKGDIFVRVEVQIPEQLTSEEKEMFERLRALHQRKNVGAASA